jgi:hypothetical protein
MPKSAVVVANPPTSTTSVNTRNQAVPTPQIPFVRASMEHQEPFVDSTVQVGTSPVAVTGGPIEVPAYGYLRSIILFVYASGGTAGGTNAVAKEDGPWSCIQDVTLMDVNGAPIVNVTGYDLFLLNKYGGYAFAGSPALFPSYSAMTTGGNFGFALRIPVELSRRDALGALPNSNSSATYRLRINQAAASAVYGTNPGGVLPTIRWRAFLDAWAQPPQQGIGGGTNATAPPALGTTQFWTETQSGVAAGANRMRLPRVGNLIRNLIFVARGSADGLRATGETAWPQDFQVEWDSHVVTNISSDLAKHLTYERYGYAALDAGVRVLDFAHDFSGHPGDGEMRDLWIPTTQSSRLELIGSFGGPANVTVLTNDVAPVGQIFL